MGWPPTRATSIARSVQGEAADLDNEFRCAHACPPGPRSSIAIRAFQPIRALLSVSDRPLVI
jgi:hypothetical protein